MARAAGSVVSVILASGTLVVLPVWAEPPPPAVPQPLTLEPEIVVQGWRYTEPSFKEQYEYHRQEYRRLKEKYGQPPTPPPRCLQDIPLTRAGENGPTLHLGCTGEDGPKGFVIRF